MTADCFNYASLKSVGKNVIVSPRVEVRRPELLSLGNHVAIDSGFYCTVSAEIGDYIHIGPYVTVVGGPSAQFRMGHFSSVAAGCRFICCSDELKGEGLVGPVGLIPEQFQDKKINAPIVLERFVALATNAVILPGVTLAEGTVIGAGSLVTKSTEPWTMYWGFPVRPCATRPREKLLAMARELGY